MRKAPALPACPTPAHPLTSAAAARAIVEVTLERRRALLSQALAALTGTVPALTDLADCLVTTLGAGHKVLVAGNGGSAAEAQHFAAELVGRFTRERDPYAVVALCADSAILTAVANDYGYELVFARQVAALGQPGDLLLLFSTSGESPNLLRAASAARARGMTVAALTGERVSRLAACCDLVARVPASETATTQEIQMVVTHLLCDIAETLLVGRAEGAGAMAGGAWSAWLAEDGQ